MKNLLAFFICIFTLQGFAQKRINGKYCLSWGGSVCIDLNKKKKINWETSGDLGIISVGSGTYEVKNNKLYLNFKKDSMDYESTVEVLNTKEAEKDSITLAIKVVDKQNLPMPRIKISIAKNPEKNYYTDMEGNVTIQNISKSEKAISIQASAMLGYENYDFNFIPNKNAKLLVTLYRAKPKLISEETFIYEIIDKSRKKLTLKNSEGQILEFKRIKE